MTSITIPSTVATIGTGAFKDCGENLALVVGGKVFVAGENGSQHRLGSLSTQSVEYLDPNATDGKTTAIVLSKDVAVSHSAAQSISSSAKAAA